MSNKIYFGLKKIFNNELTIDRFFENDFSDLDNKHMQHYQHRFLLK